MADRNIIPPPVALLHRQQNLWLYYIDNRTVYEIAELDGVAHQNVSKAILAAKKKIKKYFSNFPKNTLYFSTQIGDKQKHNFSKTGCQIAVFPAISEGTHNCATFLILEN